MSKNKNNANTNRYISKLKEYKEFIGILVFFIAGAIWLFAYFATKNQLEIQACVTDKRFIVLQNQATENNLTAIFNDSLRQQVQLKKLSNPTDEEALQLAKLEAALPDLQKQIGNAKSNIKQALGVLNSNACT